MLYIHVWFQNKGKILIWWEYYNQCGIYQRSRISLLEPRQNSLSIVCSYHVTYAFQSESTLYSCLSVKERLAQNRRDIWSWNDCNGPRTHNHLVRKQNFRYRACLKQGVPWHLGNYRVWIHSEMRTWHGKNIQYLSCFYRVWIHSKTRMWHDKDIQSNAL